MPSRFAVGNVAATGGDAGEPLATLWNSGASMGVRVYGIHVVNIANTATTLEVKRCTTRGTPNNTATPDADNNYRRRGAPTSGVLLDRGNYTANPTYSASVLLRANTQGAAGSSIDWWLPEPIIVPPGTGLTVTTSVGITGSATAFVWME